MWLTQANLQEDEQRGFWKMYLTYSFTQDDFLEWTDEQKSAWEEQHKEEDIEE